MSILESVERCRVSTNESGETKLTFAHRSKLLTFIFVGREMVELQSALMRSQMKRGEEFTVSWDRES